MSEQIRVRRLRPNARLPERATEGSTGYDVQIRPRSGLSAKGVMVTFGTIDSDYRGELLVTMYALPHREPHTIHDGDRIAQMVVARAEHPPLELVEELSATARDTGGHGSTGR